MLKKSLTKSHFLEESCLRCQLFKKTRHSTQKDAWSNTGCNSFFSLCKCLWTSTHRVLPFVHPHLKGSLSRVTDCLRAGSISQGLRGKLTTRNKGRLIPLQDKHRRGCRKKLCELPSTGMMLSHNFQINIMGKWMYRGTFFEYGIEKKNQPIF